MIERKEKYHANILLALDIAAVLLALPAAYFLRPHLYNLFDQVILEMVHPLLYPFTDYIWFYPVSVVVVLLFHFYNSGYRPPYRFHDLPKRMLIISEKLLIIAFVIGFFSFILRLEVSRSLVLIYIFAIFLLMLILRLLFILTHKRARNGYRRIILVGNSPKLAEIGLKIHRYEDRGYRILGFVSREKPTAADTNWPWLGGLDEFDEILRNQIVDEVVFIGSTEADLKNFEMVMRISEEQGIMTRLSLNFFPHAISQTSLDFIEDQPFLTFSPVPEQAFKLMIKRLFDVCGAILGIIISVPFWIIIPLLIKLTSRGPVIYRQVRCGLYGRKFVIYKFRSMIDGAEDVLWEIKHLNEMNGPTFKMRNDPRITPLGRLLRKTSIDELPQFLNVLKGEMSLVGPRAALPEEVREYTPWQKRRLSVKPGITCLWQISGRNEIDFHEWMRLDLKYIDNWSLWLDIEILLKTIPTVIFCRGAR